MTHLDAEALATEVLIRRYYDASNRGDIDGMLACLTEDVVHDINQGERREGRDRFHAFCARMAHHAKETYEDIALFVSTDGGRAAAEFNIRGQYLQSINGLPDATGQTYGLPGGTFFSIRHGQISRVTSYYNLTDWIMQVSPG